MTWRAISGMPYGSAARAMGSKRQQAEVMFQKPVSVGQVQRHPARRSIRRMFSLCILS